MAQLTESAALSLVTALRQRLALSKHRQDRIGDEILHVLDKLDRVEPSYVPTAPSNHPLLRHLPEALDLADQTAPRIAGILRPVAGLLPWRYGYNPRPDSPGLENAMGWAELIGPKAPFRSEEICLGLTLIGPNTHYLPHLHPAVELYNVLAGHVQWSTQDQARIHPPGAFILHDRNQIHAMRTSTQPLLALYSWSGDVISPSIWADLPEQRLETANAS